LKGSAVLVEGDGTREGIRVGLGIVLLELDCRAVESEAIQLRIKVERSSLGWSGCYPDWSSSGNRSPGGYWSSSGSGSPLGSSVGSKVGKLRALSRLLSRLHWLSLDWFPWPGSGWNLVTGQLLLDRLSEPLFWIHWILYTDIPVQGLEVLLVIIVSAGQT